jgi:hypothetical protein
MDEEVKCPVDAWPWDGERETCPNCDFPIARFKDLLAGKRVVYEEKLKPTFDDLVKKHTEVYEARKAEKLLEGDVVLGVVTNVEAEIIIDGKVVGKTEGKYLALENLVSGKHIVEARSAYSYGRAEVELAPKDAKRVEITLEPLKGDLRVLSEVVDVEVEVEGKRYRPPVVIRGLSAGWKDVAVYRGKAKFLTDVEVLPDRVADLMITKASVNWHTIKNTILGVIEDVDDETKIMVGLIFFCAIGGAILGATGSGGAFSGVVSGAIAGVLWGVNLVIWMSILLENEPKSKILTVIWWIIAIVVIVGPMLAIKGLIISIILGAVILMILKGI